MSDRTYYRLFAGVLALALIVRLAAAIVWQSEASQSSPFRFGDSHSYWVLASQLASGEPYQYGSENSRIFRAPLYPMFLSIAVMATDEYGEMPSWGTLILARSMGALAGLLALGIVMQTARELAGNGAGIWAGLFAAFYPGAIGMSVFLLSEAIFCPLMMVAIYGTWRFVRAESGAARAVWAIGTGVAIGLGCLARPSWSLWGIALGTYVLIGVFGWRWPQLRTRPAFGGLVLTAVAICVTMSPWWVRNYLVTDRFVPTTLQVGASLYDGWHEGATGSSDEGMAFTLEFLLAQQREDREQESRGEPLESTFEWRADRRMRIAASQWAWEHPYEVCRLAIVKLAKTWRPIPVAAELGSSMVKWAEGLSYLLIAFLGLFAAWRVRWEAGAWIFLVPALYFSVLHMVFIGSVRYRQPAVLVLCILAGVGTSLILAHRSRWNRKMETS